MPTGHPGSGEDKLQTTLRLDKDLRSRITAEAKRRGVGRNLLIEAVLASWLERHEGEELKL